MPQNSLLYQPVHVRLVAALSYNPEMVHNHTAPQAHKTFSRGDAFARGCGDGHGRPAFAAEAQSGQTGPVFDKNAGIDLIGHTVHVIDVFGVHGRRMMQAALQLNSRIDSLIGVSRPNQWNDWHH